jgi:cell fate (sporulation/competence/biofilm development) regulator YmcA (YheA/YmcA/DUF963 family)
MITKEIQELIEKLGAAIKADARFVYLEKAREAYTSDTEIAEAINEYNAQQAALAEEYKKQSPDTKAAAAIESRINELYHKVTESPVYEEYVNAEAEANEYLTEINNELTFQITGSYPCAHDCSSCGGCGHDH